MDKSIYCQTRLIDKIEKHLSSLKFIVRSALTVSTFLNLASTILILLFGEINSGSYDENYAMFIWYALLFSMWTLICCLTILPGIAIYKVLRKKDAWTSIKKETIILSTTVISVIVFYIVVKMV